MKKLLICAMALSALCACNNGVEENDVNSSVAGQVYMQFSVKMETTRSQTDGEGTTNSNANPDYEVGKDYENKVSTVDIVLVNTADTTQQTFGDATIVAAATDTYVASFDTKELKEGAEYHVYLVVNGKFKSLENVTEAGADLTVAGGIAEQNKFLMTNAQSAEYNKTTLPADLTPHNTPANPFNLGAYKVERAAARFDYKAVKTDNVYPIGLDANGAATVNVTLTEAALINMSKKFYDFRRVSADGTATGAVIGGVETLNNYVVDTDAAEKAAVTNDNIAALSASNFHYSLTAPATWVWKSLTLSEDDNWTGVAGTDEHELDGYKIWTYATENTIPGVDNQLHGISTGIVFKGKLSATDAAPEVAKTAIAAGTETIYVFKEVLYGTWTDVATAANAETNPELAAAYNYVTEKGDATAQDYADAGFTGYAPEGGKYYAYYYYWNRHNDNGDNYTMNNMEFAVVRNNVYKLCVDNISKFGHPAPGNPDPNPETPDDPDEEENYYFTVTVKVLPWVVRVNHIEF